MAGASRLAVELDEGSLLIQATRDDQGRLWAVILNAGKEDRALALTFQNLIPGLYRSENYRIGAPFCPDSLMPAPLEARETCCMASFTPELYAPAGSVCFVRLLPLER